MTRIKLRQRHLAWLSAALLLTACGGGGGNSSAGGGSSTPTTFTAVSGVAQKGPLDKGSTVTAQELNASLAPTGKQYTFQITSNLGTFTPNATFGSQYIGLTATGYYYDEIKGTVSGGEITLNGVSDLSSTQVLNVNLLTTLAYQRIQTLVAGGQSVSAATTQAENEVLAALHIPNGASYGSFDTLDLSQSGNGNKILEAISSLFVQAADTAAGTSNNASGQLATLMASFQSDIADNGVIDTSATNTALASAAQALNPATVAANLSQQYGSSVSTPFAASDITSWIDTQGDGVVGAFRFTSTAGANSSSFAFPAAVASAVVGTTVAVSGGELLVNGSQVTSAMIQAGDSVEVVDKASTPSYPAPESGLNVYLTSNGSNVAEVSLTPPTTQNFVSLLAGSSLGGTGYLDGIGSVARFSQPQGLAVDSSGNVYVADRVNALIRKITPAGVVSTLAGKFRGSTDGTGAAASFYYPNAVAVDAGGNVYVADTGNNTIRKITPAGVVTTFAGTAGTSGSLNATGTAAQFSNPSGIAIDSSGNLYVADSGNDTIREISPAGVVTTLAGTAGASGNTNATGTAALFSGPTALAVGSDGTIYVADQSNESVRKIGAGAVVTTLASNGTGLLSSPAGIAVDSSGNVYVSDLNNQSVRKITPAGAVSTLAGHAYSVNYTKGAFCQSADGSGTQVGFCGPTGLAVDGSGNVYVSDNANATVRKIASSGVVTTLAGVAANFGSADGTGSAAQFTFPGEPAIDSAGNVYVADLYSNTIRMISPAGVVSTYAGTAATTGSTDATGMAARFSSPNGVAMDSAGNLYVADTGNNTIRKIAPGGVVTTLAGTAGVKGSSDGTGAAAQFWNPLDVAVDSAGNVFVSDSGNNTIRKITSAGVVTTLAGTPYSAFGSSPTLACQSTDGTGSAARFCYPSGIAVDGGDNVYVTDSENNTIRQITPAGVVSTIAGTASTYVEGHCQSADGTGVAAEFCWPNGVAIDSAGNLLVSDSQNGTIREITPSHVVSTVVGFAGTLGNLLDASPAVISPYGVAINASGQLIISSSSALVVTRSGF